MKINEIYFFDIHQQVLIPISWKTLKKPVYTWHKLLKDFIFLLFSNKCLWIDLHHISIIIVLLWIYFDFFSASTCNETLVDTVTDDKLTASSEFGSWCSAEKSRLSSRNGWRPKDTDNNSWIQVPVLMYIKLAK